MTLFYKGVLRMKKYKALSIMSFLSFQMYGSQVSQQQWLNAFTTVQTTFIFRSRDCGTRQGRDCAEFQVLAAANSSIPDQVVDQADKYKIVQVGESKNRYAPYEPENFTIFVKRLRSESYAKLEGQYDSLADASKALLTRCQNEIKK